MNDLPTIRWCETHDAGALTSRWGPELDKGKECPVMAVRWFYDEEDRGPACVLVDKVILPADRDEMMRVLGMHPWRMLRPDSDDIVLGFRWLSDWQADEETHAQPS